MTPEEFDEIRSKMSNEELIEKTSLELSKLCKTGGRSFRMTVPVSANDTDMLFNELIKRFKAKI